MIARRTILIAAGLAAALPSFAQKDKVWRVGYLDNGSRQFNLASGRYPAFVDGMRALGYVEGRNLAIEARYADGKTERLASLAADLVAARVDVILTTGTPPTRAAQRATATIPIVTTVVTDPVAARFALSLSHPGKNITGLTNAA